METLLKIWERLEMRHGPWIALALCVLCAISTVIVIWLAQSLLGEIIVFPILPLPTTKGPDERDR